MITQLKSLIEGDNSEELRWVLDRQKEDNTEIKKQARRYILAVLSALIVLIGIWYNTTDLLPSREATAASLVEYGMLWQSNILPAHYAVAFVNSFYPVSSLFSGIGAAFIFLSLRFAYQIDQSPSCEPAGSTAELLNKEYETVEE